MKLNYTSQDLILSSFFGKVICEPNWKWNRADTPFADYDFWYVWDGEGEVILNGRHHHVRQRDCILFRPGDLTVASHNPEHPLTVTFIHFSIKGEASPLSLLPSLVSFDPSEFHEQCLNRFVHVMLAKAYGYEEESTMLLGLLLLMFERQSQTEQASGDHARHSLKRIMLDIAAYIMQNSGQQHSISDLAKQAHLSPRYFSLKFKEIMGQTIESFVIEKRIERATYLLRLGMTVSEVSEALGYRSIYFFSRQFKKVTGTNPSMIRP